MRKRNGPFPTEVQPSHDFPFGVLVPDGRRLWFRDKEDAVSAAHGIGDADLVVFFGTTVKICSEGEHQVRYVSVCVDGKIVETPKRKKRSKR